MSRVLKIVATIALMCITSRAVAEENSSTLSQVAALAANYKGEKGVVSIVIDGGGKLNMVKMILRKDFDKEFIDGIRTFAFIIYKDATAELRNKIADDIASIVAPLTEVDVKNKLKPNTNGRGYVRLHPETQRVSDLVVVMESPAAKLIYFGGEFGSEKR